MHKFIIKLEKNIIFWRNMMRDYSNYFIIILFKYMCKLYNQKITIPVFLDENNNWNIAYLANYLY